MCPGPEAPWLLAFGDFTVPGPQQPSHLARLLPYPPIRCSQVHWTGLVYLLVFSEPVWWAFYPCRCVHVQVRPCDLVLLTSCRCPTCPPSLALSVPVPPATGHAMLAPGPRTWHLTSCWLGQPRSTVPGQTPASVPPLLPPALSAPVLQGLLYSLLECL